MAWRPALITDLSAIDTLAARIHPDYPEAPEVFAERLRLHPQGCLVCAAADTVVGYAIAHPWPRDSVPKLDALLGRIPATSDAYHVHDIALLAAARGRGLGSEVVQILKQQAAALSLRTVSLVAVNRSTKFWQALGFGVKDVPALREQLLSYGADAVYMQCPA